MWRSGGLERIYRSYGIWDERQAKLGAIVDASKFFGLARAASAEVAPGAVPTSATVHLEDRPRGFAVVRGYLWVMLQSAGMTVILALFAFPIALALGLLVAIGRTYGPAWMRAPLTAYVEFLRGT